MADVLGRGTKMYGNDSVTDEELYHDGSSKMALREWAEVNRQLRKQGFQPVQVVPAHDVPVSTGGYVCLDVASNETLRHNLLSLLADCDHRQTLLHDLMEANKQLKGDVAAYQDKADSAIAKAKDLKIMLECSRKRVQELERDRNTSVEHIADESEKGRNLRNAIHRRCKQLEEAFGEKEIEVHKLQKKLKILTEEEEKRIKRQNQVFQEFKKRTARVHSLTDSKLLDIIDLYEGQLYDLKQELEMSKRGESRLHGEEDAPAFASSLRVEPTKNAKHIIKTLERQLQEADRRTKALEDEKDLLSLEMGARPQMTDYRLASQRVKKLERLLALHNISVPGEKSARDPFRAKRKFSTKLEDLDYLPVDFCQQYLRELCSELGVEDVESLLPEIRELSRQLEQAGRYQDFCYDVQQTVDRGEEGRASSFDRRHGSEGSEGTVSQSSIQHSIRTIERWRQDAGQIQALQESLNMLLARVMPTARIHFTPSHSVTDMTEIIDSLVEEETTAITSEGFEHVSRSLLEKIVSHFQQLFDIPRVSAVLTRMTDIYQRYGEAHNVLTTLRKMLGLSSESSSASVVDAVAKLGQAHNATTSQQLHHLFQTDDLGSVIRRLEEHNEFFPAFKEIMCKLFGILGVTRMDQVVPAVRALKLLSS